MKKDYLDLELKCPNCNESLIEIIYGRPDSKLIEKAKNKEIILGGCETKEFIPRYYCSNCHRSYEKNLKDFIEEK